MAIICTAAFSPLSQTGTPWFSSHMPRNGMVRPIVVVTVMVAAMQATRPRRRCLDVMASGTAMGSDQGARMRRRQPTTPPWKIMR